MACGRAILAAILAGVIAACGASPAPSPSSSGAATDVAGVATASPTTTTYASVAAPDSPRPSPAPTPRRSPMPTEVPVPPKPTGVTFDEQRSESNDPTTTEITQTVTWQAPQTEGVEIRAYGVTACFARPANPSPDTSGPCLVTHTPLPPSVRTLLGTAPASDGVVAWSWTGTFDCEGPGPAFDPRGPAYHAVVLAAYGAAGHSIFAIAEPGGWWEPGENDIVC